jgi:MFS family permease
MAIMFFIRRYRTPAQNPKEKFNSRVTKLFDERDSPRILMITLVSIFMAFYCVSENTYLRFGATYYQYIPLRLTASKSAEIVSAMALTYTIGRGISIFIAFRIKPKHMIEYHFLILLISLTILLFGQKSLTLIWIGSLTMSLGFSTIFPSINAFIREYFELTNKIGTIFTIFSASLTLPLPFILGTFIEKHPFIYLLSIGLNLLFAIIIFVLILFVIRKTKTRAKIHKRTIETFYLEYNI